MAAVLDDSLFDLLSAICAMIAERRRSIILGITTGRERRNGWTR
jgi:hypothetical protein